MAPYQGKHKTDNVPERTGIKIRSFGFTFMGHQPVLPRALPLPGVIQLTRSLDELVLVLIIYRVNCLEQFPSLPDYVCLGYFLLFH